MKREGDPQFVFRKSKYGFEQKLMESEDTSVAKIDNEKELKWREIFYPEQNGEN